MHLRIGTGSICCVFLFSLVSCLGGGDYLENNYPDDAELLSFGLSHDSIPELSTVVFTIDQKNGLIYNHDSMTYQTVIDRAVTVTYTNSLSITNVLLVTENKMTNDYDSIRWIASGDTIDVSQPFYFRVYSYYGSKMKLYNCRVNIHQVDPDSAQYHKLATNQSFLNNPDLKAITFDGKYYVYVKEGGGVSLYQSADAKEWTKVSSTDIPSDLVVSGILATDARIYGYTDSGDFYVSSNACVWTNLSEVKVKAILGFREKSPTQKAGLSLIVEKESDSLVFAFTSDLIEWQYGINKIPDNFPVTEFSTINYELMSAQYLSLVSGKNASGEWVNTVWTLNDAVQWVQLSKDKFPLPQESGTPKLQGANAFLYDDEFYLLNGQWEDGTCNKDIYYSIDKGLTWKIRPEKYNPPKAYTLRKNALWLTNPEKTVFYLLGGQQQDNTFLSDIWQVFLNKKMFAE
jgi:hypothetical protein